MDFLDFQKQYMNDHIDEDMVDTSAVNRIAVVRFDYDEYSRVSGKCRFGLVFRHTDSESRINPGEMWVCELVKNYNSANQYFGRAISKIDAEFLYGLTQAQIDNLADTVWEGNKEFFENLMFTKYGYILDSKAESIAAERILPLEKELEELRNKVSALESDNAALRSAVDAYDESIAAFSKENAELRAELSAPKKEELIPIQPKQTLDYERKTVFRTDRDTLYSSMFSDGTYSVHFSPDKAVMIIERDDDGRIECRDHVIRLGGLDMIRPFTDVEDMRVLEGNSGRICVPLD